MASIVIYIQDSSGDFFGPKTEANIHRAVRYGETISEKHFYTADQFFFYQEKNKKNILIERIYQFFSYHYPGLRNQVKNFRIFKTKSLYAQTLCFTTKVAEENKSEIIHVACSSWYPRIIVKMLWKIYSTKKVVFI